MSGSPIGPRAIENFFIGNSTGLHDRIYKLLKHNDIITEGELEHILWMEIFNWIRTKDEDKYKFNYSQYRIRSQLYYSSNKTYPDLELCIGGRTILIIELKHYYKKDLVENDIIDDIVKNNKRSKEDDGITTIVIFTSSITPEVLSPLLSKLSSKIDNCERNHIIALNQWC